MDPSRLSEFLASLPTANYATMIVSTRSHWTTSLFAEVSPKGINGVLNLFEHALQLCSEQVQETLRDRGHRRVLIREYLPGHENCLHFRKPWMEVQPLVWNWYNRGNIWEFNAVFEVSYDRATNGHLASLLLRVLHI